MASISDLRLKILDRPQIVLDERVGTGDGSATVMKLAHSPVMDSTAIIRVAGVQITAPTYFTLDYSTGKLTFASAPDDGDPVVASYDFAAFTDSELQQYLDNAGGNLALAACETLLSLVADRDRLITWARGDMRLDFDQLRRDITNVAERYLSQGRSEAGSPRADSFDWEEVV
jgi:hypothetical protein